MDDFIFGTLATEQLRQERQRALRSGVTHNHRRSPMDPRPGEAITLTLTAGPLQPAEHAWVYYTTDGSDPAGQQGTAQNGSVVAMQLATSEYDMSVWGYIRHFTATLPGQKAGTVLRYRLSSASNCAGEVFADEGQYFALYIDDDPAPKWAREAVVYQIFADRFAASSGGELPDGHNIEAVMGGTLRGITARLDYIRDLGATAVWLTPVFPSPGYHRYDATDLFDVDPRLGTLDDFRELTARAHDRGLKIILDMVPNHISDQHPIFKEARQRPDSQYRDWFEFKNWPHEYECFFQVRSMPRLNLRRPEPRGHVIEAALFWLGLGVDGFRMDYAIGPTPDFWAEFRRAVHQADPNCWIFGEVVDDGASMLPFVGVMDGCLDFTVLEAMREAFGFGRWDACRLARLLEDHDAAYPKAFLRPSFFDNHDMNRFLWMAQGDQHRLRLAALCLFTLSQPPVLYYGTEVGLSQQRDAMQHKRVVHAEARLPMIWDEKQDRHLLGYFSALAAFRRAHPAIWREERRTILADREVWAYRIGKGQQALTVALNLGGQERRIAMAEQAEIVFASQDGPVRTEGRDLILPGLSGAVL